LAVKNEQTGEIEVELTEDIYEDQENTDSEWALKSKLPFLMSIGFVESDSGTQVGVCDMTY
jgi:hypothetical protein